MTMSSPAPNPPLLSSKYNAPVQQPYGQPQFSLEYSTGGSTTDRSCRLLGPAYPGIDLYGSSYQGQSRSQRTIALESAPINTSQTPHSSGSSSQLYSPRVNLPQQIHKAAAALETTHDQNSRILPSLSFDPITSASGSANVSGGSQRHSPFITLPPPESYRSRQRSSVSPQGPHFATQAPDSSGHLRTFLSPPFALQPEPRWDDSSFSTNLHPAIFTAARGTNVSSVLRMSIDSSQNSGVVGESMGHSESTIALSTPKVREGRYDPVRATIVPYASDILSPTSSLRPQKDPDDDIDDAASSSRENF